MDSEEGKCLRCKRNLTADDNDPEFCSVCLEEECCPDCDSNTITEATHHFSELWGKHRLEYDAPLFTCTSCGFQYTDYRKEDAQTAAIARIS